MSLKAPSWLTVGLAGVAGAITIVIHIASLGLSVGFIRGATYTLTGLALVGIAPVVGPKFRTLLHLTAAENTIAALVMLLLQYVQTQIAVTGTWHAVFATAIVVATGLGFGLDTPQVLAAAWAKTHKSARKA